MRVVFSKRCLDYSVPGHPESPDRVGRIWESLLANGFRFIEAEPATERDLLLVHTPEHVNKLKRMDYESIETPPIKMKYILLSAGAVMKAAENLAFALTRPPGHHAGRDFFEGFCYVNNLAIAVRKLGKRTAILDIDVHHGQGTQDIFLGDPKVAYVSLHQSPLYPMTGLKSEQGCHNFPLFPGTDERTYFKTLGKALDVIRGFEPELLAVSMGFDTYKGDPLASQQISESGYAKLGKTVSGLNLPTFIALEGGYSDQIGKLCLNFLKEFD